MSAALGSSPTMMSAPTPPPWEQASTAEEPWPNGWFLAPITRQFHCVEDGLAIRAGSPLWTTGIEGECYCEAHAPIASS